MSGFIALPTVTEETPPPIVEIEADGWFPRVRLDDVRARMRIGQDVTDERLAEAIRGALLTVTSDLDAWQTEKAAEGAMGLEDVASPVIAGESRLVFQFRRAVACFAAAEVFEAYADFSATGSGADKAEAKRPSSDERRREGRFAIRAILGRTRSTIELI